MNVENTANTTLIASSGASLVSVISNYATIISLTITALGVLAGIVFHILALIDRRKMNAIIAQQKHEQTLMMIKAQQKRSDNSTGN